MAELIKKQKVFKDANKYLLNENVQKFVDECKKRDISTKVGKVMQEDFHYILDVTYWVKK
jgi:hypothetical protein